MAAEIRNISLSIKGEPLVSIPQWALESGKVYGLSGGTGSGKSTIGKWLGNVEPIYWTVHFNGRDSGENYPSCQPELKVGNHNSYSTALYLLQDAYQIFNPYISIFRHFKDIWKNNRSDSELDSFDEIYEILSNLGIMGPARMIHRKVHQISQGEAQRMAFVMSLIRPAPIRIYDEVFSNVDEPSSRKMLEFLRKFCQKTGTTSVVISHGIGMLNEFTDAAWTILDKTLVELDMEVSGITETPSAKVYPPLVEIRKLIVPGYGRHTLPGEPLFSLPRFMIGQGECAGIYGDSGLGKTTFLKCFLGEHDITWESCAIRIPRIGDDPLVRNTGFSGLDIRYLPQSVISAFNPAHPVGTSIREIQTIHGIPDQEILDLLISFGLAVSHLDQFPSELSGGEIQRMGIISVLVGQPHLVLLDESFSSVDATTRESVWSVVKELQESGNFAILVVSHDVEWLNRKMDRTYKLPGIVCQELNTSG